MKNYSVLDLYCGNGGASIGLYYAGFKTIVGVDIKKQPRYDFDFIQGDIHNLPVNIYDFDFIWASPPCQRFSSGTRVQGKDAHLKHPDMIPITREAFGEHEFTCIENVPGAPIRPNLILTGPTVYLPFILRKRYFETSFWVWQPQIRKMHPDEFKTGHALSVTTSMCSNNHYYRRKAQGLSGRPRIPECKHAMGIPQNYDFTYVGIGNAVPPPYSEEVGEQVLRLLS